MLGDTQPEKIVMLCGERVAVRVMEGLKARERELRVAQGESEKKKNQGIKRVAGNEKGA